MGRQVPAVHPVHCSSKGHSGHRILPPLPPSFPLLSAAGLGCRASAPNVPPLQIHAYWSTLLAHVDIAHGHLCRDLWSYGQFPCVLGWERYSQFDVISFLWKKRSLRIRQLPHGDKVLTGRKMTLTIRTNHLRDMENYCQLMASLLFFTLLRHIEVMGQHPLTLNTNKTMMYSTAREWLWMLKSCMD